LNTREEIKENIRRILGELDGRAELLLATKTVPPELINYAVTCGTRLIGENRVQELLEKYDNLDKENMEIHFIGHLQTNKVKYIIDKVSMIHSVDSLALASEIEKQAAKHNLTMKVLVEINIGSEAGKSGIAMEDTEEFLEKIGEFPHLQPCGLMIIPPKTEFPEENLHFFEKIYQKFIDIRVKKEDNKNWAVLSAGMSGDYLQAVSCGANLVRVGSAVFGARSYPV
jgi:pyridoxal phosphate enzyme (YggS family)